VYRTDWHKSVIGVAVRCPHCDNVWWIKLTDRGYLPKSWWRCHAGCHEKEERPLGGEVPLNRMGMASADGHARTSYLANRLASYTNSRAYDDHGQGVTSSQGSLPQGRESVNAGSPEGESGA
jgi:hypothetical protein